MSRIPVSRKAPSEFGGYMDISGNAGDSSPLYPGGIPLNSGRACLEVLLRHRGCRKLWVPFWVCPAAREAAHRAAAEVCCYALDAVFMPVLPSGERPPQEDTLLYPNYFGLMGENCSRLARDYPGLVVDNAQALFAPPLPGVDTFYSPRKFFGLPDGGLLYPGQPLHGAETLPQAASAAFCGHLLARVEQGASAAWQAMKENEERIAAAPPMRMSAVTERLMASLDVAYAVRRRRDNWRVLHEALGGENELRNLPDLEGVDGAPLFYPWLCRVPRLRERLIRRKVYIPHYWPGLEKSLPPGSLEESLQRHLLPLPLDQRYGADDMRRLLATIEKERAPKIYSTRPVHFFADGYIP